MLFYAILPQRGQQVLANTHDHVLRQLTRVGYMTMMMMSMTCYYDNEQKLLDDYDDDEYDLLL